MNKFIFRLFFILILFQPIHSIYSTPKEKSHKKPYVIGKLRGQLGNRFFEIAAASALAWDNNADPYFPYLIKQKRYSSDYEHIFFRCKAKPPSDAIDFEWYTPSFGYIPIPFHPNMQLSGHFQNEKYFAHHRDRLIKLFEPKSKDIEYIKNKYKKILDNPNTVSVHVRYYFREKPNSEVFIQYGKEYFSKAMALFSDESLFVITSDNIAYAKENIPTEGKNVVFIENEPHYIDFFIQTMCKHNIIPNSTFSWWSAWLNTNPNKIVVRPKVWLGGFPDIGGPDDWIKID